jgi:itaconate CoA-transferase
VSDAAAARPALDGIRVLAFEQAAAGPFGTRLLADMGAEVLKIERPVTGDPIRGWDHAVRGLSSGYVWANRGKKSITVDVKRPSGTAVLQRLADQSDVFLTNMGPGAAERAGLGWAALSARNPRLVYCNLSGYGSDGPYAEVKAYDLLVQGEAGILATTGYTDLPAKVGVPIADIAAGMYAALGISMALFQRERTGRGQYVDVSMFEAMLDWLAYFPHHYWHAGEEPARLGMRHPYIVPYGPYLARDGRFVITGVSTPSDWVRMCRDVFERPDLLEDERFVDPPARRAHRGDLEHIVERLFAELDCDEWIARLRAADLPWGELRGIAQVLAHPQVAARRLIREVDSPVGRIPTIESGLRLSDSPVSTGGIPSLGQDTVAVLQAAGFDDQAIARLHEEGAI